MESPTVKPETAAGLLVRGMVGWSRSTSAGLFGVSHGVSTMAFQRVRPTGLEYLRPVADKNGNFTTYWGVIDTLPNGGGSFLWHVHTNGRPTVAEADNTGMYRYAGVTLDGFDALASYMATPSGQRCYAAARRMSAAALAGEPIPEPGMPADRPAPAAPKPRKRGGKATA